MSDLTTHYRQLVGIARGWAISNLSGWSDETHRDLLTRHGAHAIGGRVSASTLNMAQLGNVLNDYERRGWPRQRKVFSGSPGGVKRVPDQIAHMVRLWGKLGQAGKVEKATRPALLAFCARQIGVDAVKDLDSLETAQRQKIIEALKSWLAR